MTESPSLPIAPNPQPAVPILASRGVARDISFAFPVVLLLLALLANAAMRFRLLDVPLERDEGEYAYAGQLILRGYPPYQFLYNMKWPGTYYSYALIEAVFGQTVRGIRLGVAIVNAGAILLVYLIAKRLLDSWAGAAAALAYAILSFSPSLLAFAGHATHFVVICALAALLCLLAARERRHWALYFLAGVFSGLTPIMKQPGAVFTAFILAVWAWQEVRTQPKDLRQFIRRGAALLAGIASPFVLLLGLLWATHTFGEFWLWTVKYARHYGLHLPWTQLVGLFVLRFRQMMGESLLFWIVGGIGIILLPFHRRTRAAAPILLGLLIASLIGVLPGFHFRRHYFIVMLPAVALLMGAAVYVVRPHVRSKVAWLRTASAVGLVAVPLSSALWDGREFYFEMPPLFAFRYIYWGDPFAETQSVGEYIAKHSAESDRIAVIGSEPQIYFYSRRMSVTGHVYTYAMMEDQPYAHLFQEQMIHEIEMGKPKYVVFVTNVYSWLTTPKSDTTILTWFEKYSSENLRLVGTVETNGQMAVTSNWDHPVLKKKDDQVALLAVYERISPTAAGPVGRPGIE